MHKHHTHQIFLKSLFLQDIKVVSMNTANRILLLINLLYQFPSFTACLRREDALPKVRPHCRVVEDLFKLHSPRERKTQKATLQLWEMYCELRQDCDFKLKQLLVNLISPNHYCSGAFAYGSINSSHPIPLAVN